MMNYKKNGKLAQCVLCVVFIIGFCCACHKHHDREGYMVKASSYVLSEGDELKASLTCYGGMGIKDVKFYWDGASISSSDNKNPVSYVIRQDSIGDHILGVEATLYTEDGQQQIREEQYVYVYDKAKGFFGCVMNPYNRVVSKSSKLKCEVMNIMPVGTRAANGAKVVKRIKLYIDHSKEAVVDTLTSTPFKAELPMKRLSEGRHILTVYGQGTWPSIVVDGTTMQVTALSTDYEFVVN